VEKKRVEIIETLIKDVNKTLRLFPLNKATYDKLIFKVDVSIEKKKMLLMEQLHESITKTFSIKKVDKGTISGLKNNLEIIRKVIDKLKDINYYLEEIFLKEIGVKKGFKNIKRLIEVKFPIDKKELKSIEKTVYTLIEKIIFLDNRLLKNFRKKESKVFEEEKISIKDIEKTLKKETELLCYLEAKMPPPKKLDKHLLDKLLFDHWAARVFALLTATEYQFHKESNILKKLKEDQKIKNKIEVKIIHLVKEKKDMLAIKEGRVISAAKLSRMDREWKQAINECAAALKL